MIKYKRLLTDYEGLQGCLDIHSEQGWRLVSVTPDTFRKSIAAKPEGDGLSLDDFGGDGGQPLNEYTASYYLVILSREGDREAEEHDAAMEEQLPYTSFPLFE